MSSDKARVLVVEADGLPRRQLACELERAGYAVRTAAPDASARDALEQFEPHVAIVDLKLGLSAAGFLRQARARSPTTSFVGLIGSGSGTRGIAEAVREGADSVVDGVGEPAELLPVVGRALEKARATEAAQTFRRRAQETLSLARFDSMVGNHPSMQTLLKQVAQVAATRATVLISGESGTGKELIAAAIHQNSKRSAGPFIRLNCAALAETLLESELFGHERGAFTGAVARREGRFEQAAGGTLFLDEISEMPASLQVKILRFLQEREFERVGGNETRKVDVRVVAATNRDLKGLTADGLFREDLYYRLAVVRLDVPPLRARPSDIMPLAQEFLRRSARDNELSVKGFTDVARQILERYVWPGNVRELQNVVEQAAIMAESSLVDAGDLPIMGQSSSADGYRLMIPGASLAELERYAITETLRAVGGSASKAAEILGVSRRTIQYRIKEWGLSERQRRMDQRNQASQGLPPDADE